MIKKNKNEDIILSLLFYIPVLWLAVMIAPFIHGGLPNIVANFEQITNNPLSFHFVEDTPKTVLVCTLIYVVAVGIYFSTQRNYRRKEEYGSAKWEDSKKVNYKYEDKKEKQNKLLTQNVKIGLDGKKHRRNLNTLVVGGSGAGKTRFFAKPNIMECNSSMIILDSKGEILRAVGHLLDKEGYVIKIVDLINMGKSHGYNPFKYIKSDKDVLMLISNLIKNTTPKNANTNDPFWESVTRSLMVKKLVHKQRFICLEN